MANESKKKTAPKPNVQVATQVTPEEKKVFTPKEIDPHQIVTVRNGFQGRLIYKSSKTGELFVWDGFGTEQDMEIDELRNARNSAKKYFVNNWFMFDEPWVLEYLGMSQYYRFAVSVNDFDKIFKMSVPDMEELLDQMPEGQKRSVAYRAKQLIAEGEIDSNKTIQALEKHLHTELVERD